MRRRRCWLVVLLMTGAASGTNPSLPANDRRLVHDLFQQLIEINTTHSVGSVAKAAEAMRQRLLDAGFPAADLELAGPSESKQNLIAAEQAALSGTPEQFAALGRILEMERRSEKQPAEMVTANELFHLTLAEMTGNERIITQMRLVMAHVRRLETISPLHFAERIRHEEILDAMTAGGGKLAHSLMGEHVSYALSVMIRSFC